MYLFKWVKPLELHQLDFKRVVAFMTNVETLLTASLVFSAAYIDSYGIFVIQWCYLNEWVIRDSVMLTLTTVFKEKSKRHQLSLPIKFRFKHGSIWLLWWLMMLMFLCFQHHSNQMLRFDFEADFDWQCNSIIIPLGLGQQDKSDTKKRAMCW